MKINFLPLLILILVTQLCFGQKRNPESIPAQPDNFLTFNLLLPIDPYSQRYRIGYIHGINERWKAGLAIGYGNDDIALIKNEFRIFDSYEIWEIRPELYYFFKPRRNTQSYISAELYYIDHQDQLEDNLYRIDPPNSQIIRYDKVDYRRQKYGMNFNFGGIVRLSGRFRLKIYSGLGVRVRNNDFSNPVNPVAENDFFDEFSFAENYIRDQGTNIGIDYTLGLDLIYTLGK